MSRRGYYIGGHKVIGPGSGWFSTSSKPKNKAKKAKKIRTQEEIESKRIAKAERRRQAVAQAAAKAKKAKKILTQEEITINQETTRIAKAKAERRRQAVIQAAAKIAARYTVLGQEAGVELRRYSPEGRQWLKRSPRSKRR
jgi:L-2-hydroxyglutarate oxidase LhgO